MNRKPNKGDESDSDSEDGDLPKNPVEDVNIIPLYNSFLGEYDSRFITGTNKENRRI